VKPPSNKNSALDCGSRSYHEQTQPSIRRSSECDPLGVIRPSIRAPAERCGVLAVCFRDVLRTRMPTLNQIVDTNAQWICRTHQENSSGSNPWVVLFQGHGGRHPRDSLDASKTRVLRTEASGKAPSRSALANGNIVALCFKDGDVHRDAKAIWTFADFSRSPRPFGRKLPNQLSNDRTPARDAQNQIRTRRHSVCCWRPGFLTVDAVVFRQQMQIERKTMRVFQTAGSRARIAASWCWLSSDLGNSHKC